MHIERYQQFAFICDAVRKAACREETMEEKVTRVLNWAQTNPNFDTTFVESLQERIQEGRHLTEGQEIALENIIRNFRIKTPNLPPK